MLSVFFSADIDGDDPLCYDMGSERENKEECLWSILYCVCIVQMLMVGIVIPKVLFESTKRGAISALGAALRVFAVDRNFSVAAPEALR